MRKIVSTAQGTPRPMPTFAPTESPDWPVGVAEEAETVETMEVEENTDPVMPSNAPASACCSQAALRTFKTERSRQLKIIVCFT